MFVLGNDDSYEDYDIEPNGAFLSNTAEIFYLQFLNGAADHDAFLDTYLAGGYYSAAPLGTGLVVIALNTVYFSNSAVGDVAAAAAAELSWFESTLASAKDSGKKVWVLMHIPPGADIFSTKSGVDAEGHISDASMMWKTEYEEDFLQIVSNYSDEITMMFAGHTHMDEYRLSYESLEVVPGITPYFSNDPAYKVFTYSNDTFEPSDYISWNYDLSSFSDQFNSYYTFSAAYDLRGLLDISLDALNPLLATDLTRQSLYRTYYYSGHDAASPITDANWPVYWCGVAQMTKQGVIDCVNGY
jgi:hypothetical protein